jgi:ureidoglycolate lyase
MVVRLAIQALTRAAFQPFGDVIETDGAEERDINEGYARRFHDLAKLDVMRAGGRAGLSVFRAQPRPLPIEIRMVERHADGSQAFFPLQMRDWLVVVARDGPAPSAEELVCFQARGFQGVNFAAGIWHFPLIVLGGQQDFLVVDRIGPGRNLEEHFFADSEHALIVPGLV